MDNRAVFRQLVVTFLVAFAAIFVLLKSDLLSHVSYSIEKGRLAALRETMPTEEQLTEASLPAREVARLVSPAVVFIETQGPPPTSFHGIPLEDLLQEMEKDGADEGEIEERRRYFREQLDRLGRQSGAGSGFIVDAEHGLILTNAHVIEGADVIDVQLADGRRYTAQVVGADPPTDLAIIRIDADRLHQVELGNSDQVEVGDGVFALGNPFRLAGTVSRGIISGKGRHSGVDIGGVVYKGFLQTDAVINPGNSGGPLVNMRGEVIGVNTAIATQTGHYDGVGFAIPSSRVVDVMPKLVRGETIERGFLGIGLRGVSELPQRVAELGWTEDYGVLVVHVEPGSGAHAAGMHTGDILLSIDGMRVEAPHQLIEAVGQMSPGTVAAVDLWRKGRRLTVEVTLGARPHRR